MKTIPAFLFVCLLVLSACASFQPTQKDPAATWSSMDPLSIPGHIRRSQFEKGNLVQNSSFEKGRRENGETGAAFSLDGWSIVGKNVYWVELDAVPVDSEEVHSGRHAVKIVRRGAGELDTAEGLISDFIPVIPGNYDFYYHVKLKDIGGSRLRWGGRLGDAVTVRVFFFDEDRQPLDSTAVNPLSAKGIDNSNKSFSFANQWSIPGFPWGKVRARTYNYPFSEGDLPDDTRYVRLFIGLQGSGILWLDDVDFRFSRWNFTALERLAPFFERPLAPEDSLIPTPKTIRRIGEVVYYRPGMPQARFPVIVLPDNPAAAERTAAGLLQKKLAEVFNPEVPAEKVSPGIIRVIETGLSVEEALSAQLVFSIGRNEVYRRLRPDLPLEFISGNPQAYVIGARQLEGSHVVYLMGGSPTGNLYAATTAVQLIDPVKGVYHSAAVQDEPDFLGRSFRMKDWQSHAELKSDLDGLQQMALYKLNKVYIGHTRGDKYWYRPSALYRRGVASVGRACKENGGLHLAMMANPYSHFPFEAPLQALEPETLNAWTHSSPQSIERLENLFRIGLEAGADTIMLLADDFVPHAGDHPRGYTLYAPEDKKRFFNLQNAQSYVIHQLKARLHADYPRTRLEFCPPWYSNEHIDRSRGKAEIYLRELAFQIPREVAIVWTGPTVRSLSVDAADLHRYTGLIGRRPMFWDNTLYARNLETDTYGGYATYYPGKVRMCNLFEPFDAYRPDHFENDNDGRQMFVNAAAFTEIYRIKLATVADYLWNTADYDPELSLWKVLSRRYGPLFSRQLLLFNEAYYGLYDVCLRMERDGAQEADVREGRQFLAGIDNALGGLSAVPDASSRLLKELGTLRDKQAARFGVLSPVSNR